MIDQTKLKKRVISKLLNQNDVARMANIEVSKFSRWLNSDKKLNEDEAIKIKDALLK